MKEIERDLKANANLDNITEEGKSVVEEIIDYKLKPVTALPADPDESVFYFVIE